MTTIKVGVREFRERIAKFLESESPVAVTRHGETVGVYIPTRRKRPKTAGLDELRAAAERLAKLLADADEEEVVAEFKQLRRQKKGPSR
jgi:PHD/YefM family antitoxin component YafN of YafNO toxin-antitoxin module